MRGDGVWLDLTAETRFRSRASSCQICGGQSGIGTGSSPCNAFSRCHYLSTCATYSSSCYFCHKDKRPTSVNFQIKQRSTWNWGLCKEKCIVDCIGDSGGSNNGFFIVSASTSRLLTLSDPTSDLVRQYDFPVLLRCRKTSDTGFVAFVRPLSEPVRRFFSCSTDFSQQIAQVVLFLCLHGFLF
jgi:hypothetical protein